MPAIAKKKKKSEKLSYNGTLPAKTWLFLPIIWLTLTACASTPINSGQSEAPDPLQQTISEVETLIISFSPINLRRAFRKATTGELAGNERGRELAYISWSMLKIFYPGEDVANITFNLEENSIYPELVREIRLGIFRDLPPAETDLIVSMLQSLSILFSNDRQTLEKCRQLAEQLVKSGQSSILSHYINGLIMEKENNYALALSFYQTIVALNPGCYPAKIAINKLNLFHFNRYDANSLNNLAVNYNGDGRISALQAYYALHSQDMAAAEKFSRLAVMQEPLFLTALLSRAETSFIMQDMSNVAEQLARVPAAQHNDIAYLDLKIRLALAENDLSAANTAVGNATEMYPVHKPFADYSLTLDKLLGKKGRENLPINLNSQQEVEIARLSYQQEMAAANFQQAAIWAEMLLSDDSDRQTVYNAWLSSYLADDLPRAFTHARSLAALADDTDSRNVLPLIRTQIVSGDCQTVLPAIERYLLLSQDDRTDSLLLTFKSRCVPEPQQKKELLQQALLLDPLNMESLTEMGKLYRRLGQTELAAITDEVIFSLTDLPTLQNRMRQNYITSLKARQ